MAKETFRLDLDNADFLAKLQQSLMAVQAVGAAENVAGLISGFQTMMVILGPAIAVVAALKTALNLTLEAESIQSVNKQFEILTENAGISTTKLREGLIKAADGLADDTDLLKEANKALVTLGSSAEKLPQLWEVAHKASVIYGKSAFETFEDLNQAVSMGNVRMLKRMGIIVDAKSAQERYAKSIGLTVDELSEEGKRLAILDDVLNKSNTNLGKVDTSVKSTSESMARFATATKQAVEAITLTLGTKFKSSIGSVFKWLTDQLNTFTSQWKFLFGERDESIKAASELFQKEQDKLIQKTTKLEEHIKRLKAVGIIPTDAINELERTKKALDELIPIVNKYKASVAKMNEVGVEEDKKATAAKLANQEAILQKTQKVNELITNLQKDRIKYELETVMEERQITALMAEEKANIEKKYHDQYIKMKDKEHILGEQLKRLEVELERNKTAELKAIDMRYEDERWKYEQKMWQNRIKAADSYFKKFATGTKLAMAKSKHSLQDWEATSEEVFDAFESSISGAFMSAAEAGDNLGNALMKAMLHSIGQIAVAKGTALFLSSIWPPQAPGLAAGSALIAFGSGLLALAGSIGGGGTETAAVSTGGGGGGTVAAEAVESSDSTLSTTAPSPAESEVPRKTVSITIMGSYFDTEETRRRLTEIVRDSSDATDFKILSVGGRI